MRLRHLLTDHCNRALRNSAIDKSMPIYDRSRNGNENIPLANLTRGAPTLLGTKRTHINSCAAMYRFDVHIV